MEKYTNIEEDLISFETAQLAKEKGFDVNSNEVYATSEELPELHNWHKGERFKRTFSGSFARENWDPSLFMNAPTQALLQKWLRISHNIEVEVYKTLAEGGVAYGVQGEKWEKVEYGFATKDLFNYYEYSHKDAFEKGLFEALKTIE